MIENLTRVLDAYYSTVSNSRDTFLNYMDLKLNIFKSSVSSKTVANIRDDLLRKFGLINMISQRELRDVKLVELAQEVQRLKKVIAEQANLYNQDYDSFEKELTVDKKVKG